MFEELRDRARSGWLAAAGTGLVLLGSVPFYAGVRTRGWFASGPLPAQHPTLYVFNAQGRLSRLAGSTGSLGLAYYWLVAIPVAYLLLAGWFAIRARRTGLQFRWPVYVGA